MSRRDYTDVLTGGVLTGLGLFVAAYTVVNYRLGTFNNMGPGMIPLGLGVIVAIFGLCILVPGMFRGGVAPKMEIRSFIVILASIAIFAMTVRWIGLLPAVALTTIASTLAIDDISPVRSLALAAVLSVLAGLIFIVGLGLPIAAFRWPF